MLRKRLRERPVQEGLRSIFEKAMTDIMFEIPSREDVQKCIVTKGTINEEKEPTLVLGDEKNKNSEADAS